MVRTSIYLTEKQRIALRDLARQTGQKQSDLIRRAMLEQAKGMWQDRDDLPDFRALRREFDR